ncbi:MAG: DNA/RNA nuclease SfsA [Deltaproteobacteria bacterium]|nr:DNA/RNA nuclease SfsA [Deltaproteobacteria bacterium]
MFNPNLYVDPNAAPNADPNADPIAIAWPPLTKGILLKRYKRFLAEVRLEAGQVITAHTSNTGRMLTCSTPGSEVYLSAASNPQRRCPYTWEMTKTKDGLVGVNTTLPNRLAFLAAKNGYFPTWPKNPAITLEAKVGASRLDLRLDQPHGPSLWVEVKNCSLGQGEVAMFPDAVSLRGQKHLATLTDLTRQGERGIILILVQRPAKLFRPAAHLDPQFAAALKAAIEGGVELLVYRVALSLTEARLAEPLVVDLE